MDRCLPWRMPQGADAWQECCQPGAVSATLAWPAIMHNAARCHHAQLSPIKCATRPFLHKTVEASNVLDTSPASSPRWMCPAGQGPSVRVELLRTSARLWSRQLHQHCQLIQVNGFKAGHQWKFLIASYENIRKFSADLKGTIDLLVCDEGHRLKAKNLNSTMKALLELGCPRRIILTGTPCQNNLLECVLCCLHACTTGYHRMACYVVQLLRSVTSS